MPSKAQPTSMCRERDTSQIPPIRKCRSTESEIVEKLRQETTELKKLVSELVNEICILKGTAIYFFIISFGRTFKIIC